MRMRSTNGRLNVRSRNRLIRRRKFVCGLSRERRIGPQRTAYSRNKKSRWSSRSLPLLSRNNFACLRSSCARSSKSSRNSLAMISRRNGKELKSPKSSQSSERRLKKPTIKLQSLKMVRISKSRRRQRQKLRRLKRLRLSSWSKSVKTRQQGNKKRTS